jgi:thiol-disulfide isomerase/thioredoxin
MSGDEHPRSGMKLRLATLLLVALILAAGYWRWSRPMAVPAIEIVTLSGERLPLTPPGRTSLLAFWSPSCPPCLVEIPQLADLFQRFGEEGLNLIAIASSGDRPDSVLNSVRDHKIPYPVSLDLHGEIARTLEVEAIPTLVLIGPDGRVRERYLGAFTPARLAAEIQYSLEGG